MLTPIRRAYCVDEGADAASPLCLGDHVVHERRLARCLGSEDLDHAASRQTADAECHVERQRSRGHRTDRDLRPIAHLHDRAFAELPLDLAECCLESFFAIHRDQPPKSDEPRGTDSSNSYRAPPGPSREW
jgi:hypothetical protein